MTEIYNIRIGDLLYRKNEEVPGIAALVYKLTPKYAYYAVCAPREDNIGQAYITKGHKVLKSKLYQNIQSGSVGISYAAGTSRRRTIDASRLTPPLDNA